MHMHLYNSFCILTEQVLVKYVRILALYLPREHEKGINPVISLSHEEANQYEY